MLHPLSGKYNYGGICRLCGTALGRQRRSPRLLSRVRRKTAAVKSAETVRAAALLLRSGGSRRRCRLSLDRLRFQSLQHGARSPMPGGINRQRNRSDHERHRRPGRGLGERTGSAPRTECRLAALPAKRRRNIAALAALQQNHNDDEETDQDMDRSDEVNHKFEFFPRCCDKFPDVRDKFMVRKGGFEPPRLSAPPPQDGVSASSTTSALCKLPAINSLTSSFSEGIPNCTGFCTDWLHAMRPPATANPPAAPTVLWTAGCRPQPPAGARNASRC